MENNFKEGEKVIYNGEERIIYSVYDNGYVSLCLHDYDDVEEDYQTPIKELSKINLVE
jgi:hypothetical protein